MKQEPDINKLKFPEPDPDLLTALAGIVGERHVSGRALDRLAVSRDSWPQGYFWMREGRAPLLPAAVAWPGSEDEVAELIMWCAMNRVPLTPAAGGSGVCGASIPARGGIVMDLKRMNRPLELNEINHTAEAQAGIMGETWERWLNRRGFSLGHFPSSMYCSTLGGWLASRSAGQLSSKYGKIEDMALSLSGVLADGSKFTSSDSPKSAAGPDLDQLIIGSEGTLAVITSAVMAVHRLPERSAFRGFMFEDLESGVRAMRLVMRAGLDPAVMRLYDELDTRFHAKSLGAEGPGCLLVAGFEGPDHELTRAKAAKGFSILAEAGRDLGPGPGEAWLGRRYSVSYNQSTVLSLGHTILDTCEVAAVWSKIPGLYHAVRGAIAPHALVTAHISHVYSVGAAIYFTFVAGSEEPPAAEAYKAAWRAAMEACLQAGGTISHHHGIGAHKARWMRAELGPALDIFNDLKLRLDPGTILNPAKMGIGDTETEDRDDQFL
ncbi:MAG TPA: FAD-binding oxidoreductase [bacterium]|nr:FAD-binding oxidoreductase [bacterium]